MLRHLRNIAIIVLLALAISVLPAGGNVASGILVALSLVFLFVIGLLLVRFWRASELTLETLDERSRWLLHGGLGAIAAMIAGTDEMLASGVGTVVWVAVLAGSGWLVFTTWREARSF